MIETRSAIRSSIGFSVLLTTSIERPCIATSVSMYLKPKRVKRSLCSTTIIVTVGLPKGFHLNNMTSKRESLWLEGIIPLAMKIISDDVKSLEFLIADCDTRRIGIEILDGRDD